MNTLDHNYRLLVSAIVKTAAHDGETDTESIAWLRELCDLANFDFDWIRKNMKAPASGNSSGGTPSVPVRRRGRKSHARE